MSKAEEKARERYPECWIRDINHGCEIDTNRVKRSAFLEGYEQALRDIEKEKEEIKELNSLTGKELYSPKIEVQKTPVKPQRRKWFSFSWYNIRKQAEDSYDKTYNEVYQKNKADYFKIVAHWNWDVPYIPFEGISFIHSWNRTDLVFTGADNLYWVILRESPRYDERAKWHFKLMKTHNDHCSAG